MFQLPEATVALRPRIALTVVLVTVLALLGGCMGPSRSNWRAGSRGLPFEAWVTIVQDSSGAIQPQVGVSVPYRSLVFHRDQDLYRSGLQVTVIARRDGKQVGGGVATSEVAIDQTVDRRGDRTLEVRAPVRLRGQAEVALDVLAEVPGTARRWRRQLALDPGMLSAAPLLIGDVQTNLTPGRDGRQVLTAAHDTLRLVIDVLRPVRAPVWPTGGVDLVASIRGPVRDDRRQWRQIPRLLLQRPGRLLGLVLPWIW